MGKQSVVELGEQLDEQLLTLGTIPFTGFIANVWGLPDLLVTVYITVPVSFTLRVIVFELGGSGVNVHTGLSALASGLKSVNNRKTKNTFAGTEFMITSL